MTYYFLGSVPDEHGSPAAGLTTSSVRFDGDYAPGATQVSAGNSAVTGGISRLFLGPEIDECWMHSSYRSNSSSATGGWITGNDEFYFMQFLNPSGAFLCGAARKASGVMELIALGDTRESITLDFSEFQPTDVFQYDLHCEITATHVVVELFKQGVSLGSVSAAYTGTAPKVGGFRFGPHYGSGSSSIGGNHSEMIVSDQTTLGRRLASLRPAADGFHTDWNGAYTDIEDFAGTIDTETVGARSSWTVGAYAGGASIEAVVSQLWALPIGGAIGGVAPMTRIGSTDYDLTPVSPLFGVPNIDSWELNPATSAAWAPADLSSIEFGVLAVAP